MRVFVAGGTGAVGRRLVPLLVKHGHEVVAMTRDPAKHAILTADGADAVVADGLDRAQAIAAVTQARPDVVVHQMTALSGELNMHRFARTFAETNRLPTTPDWMLGSFWAQPSAYSIGTPATRHPGSPACPATSSSGLSMR